MHITLDKNKHSSLPQHSDSSAKTQPSEIDQKHINEFSALVMGEQHFYKKMGMTFISEMLS